MHEKSPFRKGVGGSNPISAKVLVYKDAKFNIPISKNDVKKKPIGLENRFKISYYVSNEA